jgi:hypothetical protein
MVNLTYPPLDTDLLLQVKSNKGKCGEVRFSHFRYIPAIFELNEFDKF